MCSARSAWLKRGTPFVPAMLARETSRHRLRQPTCGAGEQDEMRAADPLADPAQVLLDRLAMAGQPGARRVAAGAGRPSVASGWRGRRDRRAIAPRPGGPAPARSARRDDDPGRVGDGRVEQLDLETDDRVEPGGLGRADETDRAVQAVVVRDGQPGQPQLDGPLDQVVGRRGPVEEREVGVAVEFGVRGRCHGSLRSGSRLTGGSPV